MPMLFFGKKLLTDNSAQEMARVRGLLERAGIPYRQRTKLYQMSAMRHANTMAYASTNLSMASTDRQQQTYVYILYVRRKDYVRAKEIIA